MLLVGMFGFGSVDKSMSWPDEGEGNGEQDGEGDVDAQGGPEGIGLEGSLEWIRE